MCLGNSGNQHGKTFFDFFWARGVGEKPHACWVELDYLGMLEDKIPGKGGMGCAFNKNTPSIYPNRATPLVVVSSTTP